jgi:hypothetical protein
MTKKDLEDFYSRSPVPVDDDCRDHVLAEYRPGLVYRTEVTGACQATVTVGTTGPKGGDWGHGSRTLLSIQTDGFADPGGEPYRLQLLTGGDEELRVLILALEFAASVLRAQSAGVR